MRRPKTVWVDGVSGEARRCEYMGWSMGDEAVLVERPGGVSGEASKFEYEGPGQGE